MKFIHSGFNSGCVVVGVFLDLTKTFDSIDHEILLNVLGNVGLDDTALAWFASYLSGRSLFVSADRLSSSMFAISHGVIQGSVLGPALFLICINSVLVSANSRYENFRAVSFANDTSFLLHVRRDNDGRAADLSFLDKCLSQLSIIFSALRLSVNHSKSKLVWFRPRRSAPDFFPTQVCWNVVNLSLIDRRWCALVLRLILVCHTTYISQPVGTN